MAFITIAGEQLIAQKQGASEVLNITHFVLANISGLGDEPSNRIESLPISGNIVDTRAVTKQGYINANQVVYSLSIDSTVGPYTFNWVGLKSAEGVLVACAHISPQVKSANNGATPGNNLTRNFLLAFSGIQATTAIAIPAETWQIDFTTRLLQIDQRERLSNFDVNGAGAFFLDGFKVEFVSGTTYKVKAGIGYIGGIRCQLSSDTNITAASPPKGVWVDASLQGDINGVSAITSLLVSFNDISNYTDGLGFEHFVFKVAHIPSSGIVNDLRPIAPIYLLRNDVVPQAEAELGTASTPRAWTALRVKQAIDTNVPDATETNKGKVELATAAETIIGTDNSRAVHPAGLEAKLAQFPVASEIQRGKVELATAAETIAGLSKELAVHPAGLKARLDALPALPTASETVQGKIELATAAETLTGTDATKAVHPAGLKSVANTKLSTGYMMVVDQKATNTAGGSSVTGLNHRTLNTVLSNTILGASLSNNLISLPPGTYRVSGSAPAVANTHKSIFYNETDDLNYIYGSSENSIGIDDIAQTRSFFKGRFNITEAKNFSVKTYLNSGRTTDGLGSMAGFGLPEVYTQVEIIKEL